MSRENASQPVAERWLRVWWLLTWGCVGMAIGALHHIGQENRIQLGGEFQHTLTASLYFGLAIAGGVELAMWGPVPSLKRGQRIAGGIAAVALFGLASDIAVYAASVLLIVLAQQPGALQAALRRAPLLWLGRVSYSLYLVHVPTLVATVVRDRGDVPAGRGAVARVGALGGAAPPPLPRAQRSGNAADRRRGRLRPDLGRRRRVVPRSGQPALTFGRPGDG
ncbi:MAG TPA: hypothetical protein VEX11_04420 [Acetobacteraceae bacterium]|nr:hypothetical protein [Acetobacteraceae bacterium]